MAIEHADFEGVERLAAVTGGATASTFDHPELAVLGECKKIEEVGGESDLRGRRTGVPYSSSSRPLLQRPHRLRFLMYFYEVHGMT